MYNYVQSPPIFRHAIVSSTYPCQSVSQSIHRSSRGLLCGHLFPIALVEAKGDVLRGKFFSKRRTEEAKEDFFGKLVLEA